MTTNSENSRKKCVETVVSLRLCLPSVLLVHSLSPLFTIFLKRFVSQTLSSPALARATSPTLHLPLPPLACTSRRWTRVISLSHSLVCPGLPSMFVYPCVLLLQFVLELPVISYRSWNIIVSIFDFVLNIRYNGCLCSG